MPLRRLRMANSGFLLGFRRFILREGRCWNRRSDLLVSTSRLELSADLAPRLFRNHSEKFGDIQSMRGVLFETTTTPFDLQTSAMMMTALLRASSA